MTRTIAAAVFALLAFTVSAHAANVDVLSLTFGGSEAFSGTVTFNGDYSQLTAVDGFLTGYASLAKPGNYISGPDPFDNVLENTISSGPNEYFALLGDTGQLPFVTASGSSYLIGIDYFDVKGTPILYSAYLDSSVFGRELSTSGKISPTPLPTALPLFATAILGLAGVAAVKKSRPAAASG